MQTVSDYYGALVKTMKTNMHHYQQCYLLYLHMIRLYLHMIRLNKADVPFDYPKLDNSGHINELRN